MTRFYILPANAVSFDTEEALAAHIGNKPTDGMVVVKGVALAPKMQLTLAGHRSGCAHATGTARCRRALAGGEGRRAGVLPARRRGEQAEVHRSRRHGDGHGLGGDRLDDAGEGAGEVRGRWNGGGEGEVLQARGGGRRDGEHAMSTEQEHKVDRTGWYEGPWDNEPDREEWRSQGFPCLIVHSGGTGALCGYVGVTKGHPWFEVGDYSVNADVHGGITYNAKCVGAICHVPQANESDDVWWLGFDCSHAWDVAPASQATFRRLGYPMFDSHESEYRTIAYVRSEVERLARQAAEATP